MADIGLDDTIALPDAVNTDCDLVPTFSSIQEKYLGPSCTFASCHDADKPAGDLDLTEGNSYDSLVDMAAAADATETLVISGSGDVIEPDGGIAAVGSGGRYAEAAARALMQHSDLSSREIAEAAMGIASDICIYTNAHLTVETLESADD